MTDIEKYLQPFKQIGIQKGDKLFISSDIKRLAFEYYEAYDKMFDPNEFIDFLIELVGDGGTIIFPTYNWDFCHGTMWNYHKTKCETGVLGTYALKRVDFKRTLHPIYSFAVWGKDQEYLCSLTNVSSFGQDSPFAYFEESHVKNIIIDVSFTNCLTFVHYVEQKSGCVNYRFEKMFAGNYCDESGQLTFRNYSMFVRNLEMNVVNNFDVMEEQLLERHIARRIMMNDIPITFMDMSDIVAPILDDIKHNKSRKLCTYIGQ